jgi:hypothetical protein
MRILTDRAEGSQTEANELVSCFDALRGAQSWKLEILNPIGT